jgi:cell division protein ZipA
MAELRWILLAAGALLIAGIYAWGLRSRRRSAAAGHERAARVEPTRTVVLVGEEARAEPRLDAGDDEEELPDEAILTEEAPAAEPPDRPAARRPTAPLRREPRLEADDGAPVAAARADLRAEPRAEFRTEPRIEPRVESRAEPRVEPRIAPERQATAAPQREPAADAGRDAAPKAAAQKIVALRAVAPPGEQFEGARLLEVLQASGFSFGRYRIFHRLDASGRPLVSLASLREPGTFEPQRMPELTFRGVVLFAVIPGPLPPGRAFEELIATARALAAKLGAQLQDERGAPLGVQRVGQLRDEVAEYERARGAAPVG